MSVARIPRTHLLDGGGEEIVTVEDLRILGKEAEDETGHEVIQILAAVGGIPRGIFAKQLDVEAVQTACSLDVEGILPNLPDRGDSSERQEKSEVI